MTDAGTSPVFGFPRRGSAGVSPGSVGEYRPKHARGVVAARLSPARGRSWPLLPVRTNAGAQADAAMRSLQLALSAYIAAERAGASDDIALSCADEVIHRRLVLYGMLARLGMRPAGHFDIQLVRDAALLRYRSP